MKLTVLKCKNAKPLDKPYKLFDGGGLYLEVLPNGGRYWRLKYRVRGKEKCIALGVYPAVSLQEAREKREKEKKLLQEGFDPMLARREKKQLATFEANQTFELVAKEWHTARYERWTSRHADNILRRLELDVFPEIGSIPITMLSAPHVIACLQKIEKRDAHEMARRASQVCGQVLRYAVQTGRIKHNFIPDLKGALVGRQSVPFAAIEPDEIPALLKALNTNDARLFGQTILATKLMLLTFVRTSELIEAKWDEINFEKAEWIIPAERMKMRRLHVVPLSRQAVKLFEEQRKRSGKRDHVFPSIPRPRKPMSNATILKGLERIGYKGRMTGHGFRALAMTTIKEKLGYRHEVIDRQLAHVPGSKVDRAYDRSKFLPERQKMMQDWADYLDGLA